MIPKEILDRLDAVLDTYKQNANVAGEAYRQNVSTALGKLKNSFNAAA